MSKTQLYARIKKSSKYYGQTPDGLKFEVFILHGGEYVVQGGPGGQYRLSDVNLFAEDQAGVLVRIL